MKLYIAVMIGGAVGAGLRYGVGAALAPVEPLPTFVINVIGCFGLGWLLNHEKIKQRWPETVRIGLGTGFFGGLTTFSTYAMQAGLMMSAGLLATASAYLLASILFGLLAAWLGMRTARRGGEA
ncbi:CrcB family protein [Tumebacillus sp. DT12]|uniref:Fluoride-specific ion channel FluC n=1 Tax=Tumebacillus lacus TaxID=2995335 RepID=A0ABT3X6A5_9BACL|nr:CrcB family protein [Tumebacillus lacus]MCX7571120.1 CrcB family protein [Tumebacillus lacus]